MADRRCSSGSPFRRPSTRSISSSSNDSDPRSAPAHAARPQRGRRSPRLAPQSLPESASVSGSRLGSATIRFERDRLERLRRLVLEAVRHGRPAPRMPFRSAPGSGGACTSGPGRGRVRATPSRRRPGRGAAAMLRAAPPPSSSRRSPSTVPIIQLPRRAKNTPFSTARLRSEHPELEHVAGRVRLGPRVEEKSARFDAAPGRPHAGGSTAVIAFWKGDRGASRPRRPPRRTHPNPGGESTPQEFAGKHRASVAAGRNRSPAPRSFPSGR